nr:MAG TPA: hypothetical protein [Caudoviricetes sp.]
MKRKTYEKKRYATISIRSIRCSPLKSDFLICARFALISDIFRKLANTQENPSCHISENGMSL